VSVAIGLALGVAGGLVGWRLLRSVYEADVFTRSNYRGRTIITGAGLLVPLVVVAFEAAADLAATFDVQLNASTVGPRRAVLVVALGLGALGLLDDLAGEGESGGFRGHLRALARGRLTTGSLKLFGGAAVAVAAVFGPRTDTPGRLLADAALVALSANLANLFDRAPGRLLKVTGLAFVVLAVATGAPAELVAVAVTVGAGLALIVPDLREQVMVGDVGANVLGATLGVGVVVATAPTTRTIVLLVVAALNLASERVSFTSVIDRTAPLRALDRLGRRSAT
jgi:UDP-N-acetylmuramyl pentapeptide phosphotransferase/UDP-N-acetylglucosamine-1-phosphate transferase